MSNLPSSGVEESPGRDLVLFDTERKAKFLLNIRTTGMLQLSCRAAGISPSTVRSHLLTDPLLQAAYEEAMADFKESIELEAYRRAIVGWDEEVYQQGEFVGTMRKFDSRLLELYLKRHIPEYKEKFEVAHHMAPGVLAVPIKQSEEEWMKDVDEAEIVEEPEQGVLPSSGVQPDQARPEGSE